MLFLPRESDMYGNYCVSLESDIDMIFAAQNARLGKYHVCQEYEIGHSLAKLLTEGFVWFPDPISPPALLLWGFPQRDPPLVISSAFKVTSKTPLFLEGCISLL